MNVLIVEDDFVSRKALNIALSSHLDVEFACNGEEGINEVISSYKSGKRYDAVFLDINMPKYDGHEVLKKIREYENANGVHGKDGIKIIMTTAMGDSNSILDAFRAQCDGYIVKPVTLSKISQCLKQVGISVSF